MHRKYYRGEERFCSGDRREPFDVRDFWRFAFGDILDNTRRGSLAEFIVARALEINTDIPREDWSAYDLEYNGKRIEVKASAYLQSWNLANGKISKPRFSVAPARRFDADKGGYTGELCRQSDYYVFCLFEDIDPERYNILDVSHWSFYVVPTADLDRLYPHSKSLSLENVRGIGKKTQYHEIKNVVDEQITHAKS